MTAFIFLKNCQLMNTLQKKEQVNLYKTRIFDIANSWYFVTGSVPEIKIWSTVI